MKYKSKTKEINKKSIQNERRSHETLMGQLGYYNYLKVLLLCKIEKDGWILNNKREQVKDIMRKILEEKTYNTFSLTEEEEEEVLNEEFKYIEILNNLKVTEGSTSLEEYKKKMNSKKWFYEELRLLKRIKEISYDQLTNSLILVIDFKVLLLITKDQLNL